MTKEIKYEVKEKFGVLDSDSKRPKELRLVQWGNNKDKYDIRSWWDNGDGTESCGKGVTFDYEELYSLYEILKKMFDETN